MLLLWHIENRDGSRDHALSWHTDNVVAMDAQFVMKSLHRADAVVDEDALERVRLGAIWPLGGFEKRFNLRAAGLRRSCGACRALIGGEQLGGCSLEFTEDFDEEGNLRLVVDKVGAQRGTE